MFGFFITSINFLGLIDRCQYLGSTLFTAFTAILANDLQDIVDYVQNIVRGWQTMIIAIITVQLCIEITYRCLHALKSNKLLTEYSMFIIAKTAERLPTGAHGLGQNHTSGVHSLRWHWLSVCCKTVNNDNQILITQKLTWMAIFSPEICPSGWLFL